LFECQYKLAHALNRLSFYYSGVGHRGGTDEMTTDMSRDKAVEVVEEAIKIFQEVKCNTTLRHGSHGGSGSSKE